MSAWCTDPTITSGAWPVMADESDTAATWYYATEQVQVVAVWTEKKKGRGEVVAPILLLLAGASGIAALKRRKKETSI